ncbi:response regulator [Pseudochryseolinea flava]|uniref:Response regulator n=2 Tax=Pseudochryseolinea flava TaxID=2059302 RepID=A0A364Y8T3_9BACT|nr:response regulator [Pseudochryseolinea flava]
MSNPINVLLADDDRDDCLLFEDALAELPFQSKLSLVHDGEQLLSFLAKTSSLPDILFLDLNMPRKNGFDCLKEIKKDSRIDELPVVIFSTSFDLDVVKLLHSKGAHLYVRKPDDFTNLKKVISKVLDHDFKNDGSVALDKFVIRP